MSRRRCGYVLSLVLAATAAALVLGCQPQPQTPLDDFGPLPSFNLTDQTGAAFDSSSLAGRAALVDFIYTHCTDACPLLSANFAQVQKRVADDQRLASRAVLVSISVDPQHDTPPVLAEYGQQFKADPSGWKLLTGDWDAVYDTLSAFKVAVKTPRPAADSPPPGGTELSHTTRVVLVDPQGEMRAYLHGEDATPDELTDALRRVLR